MHLFDDAAGILASVPIVGSSIPLGVGAALAMRQAGQNGVAVVFLGDAAIEEGVFHESANFAVLKKLPDLFACENNLFSVYTHLDDRQPSHDLCRYAKALGLHSAVTDGNDVVSVRETASTLIKTAREGEGPGFIQMDTYRWREHCGPSYDDDLAYRDSQEVEDWLERCPVAGLEKQLLGESLMSADTRAAIAEEFRLEIDAAFDAALASDLPAPTTVSDNIYA